MAKRICSILAQQLSEELATLQKAIQNVSFSGVSLGGFFIGLLHGALSFVVNYLEEQWERFMQSVMTLTTGVVSEAIAAFIVEPLKAIFMALGDMISLGGFYILSMGSLFEKQKFDEELNAFADFLKSYADLLEEVSNLLDLLMDEVRSVNFAYYYEQALKAKTLLEQAIQIYSDPAIDSASYNEATRLVLQAKSYCGQAASRLLNVPYNVLEDVGDKKPMRLYWKERKKRIEEAGDAIKALIDGSSSSRDTLKEAAKKASVSALEDYRIRFSRIARISRDMAEHASKISHRSWYLLIVINTAVLLKEVLEEFKNYPYRLLASVAKQPARMATEVLDQIIEIHETIFNRKISSDEYLSAVNEVSKLFDRAAYEPVVGSYFFTAFTLLKPYSASLEYSKWDQLVFETLDFKEMHLAISRAASIVVDSFAYFLEAIRLLNSSSRDEIAKARSRLNLYVSEIRDHANRMTRAASTVSTIIDAKRTIMSELLEFYSASAENAKEAAESAIATLTTILQYIGVSSLTLTAAAAVFSCIFEAKKPASIVVNPEYHVTQNFLLSKFQAKIQALRDLLKSDTGETLSVLNNRISALERLIQSLSEFDP